MAWRRRLKGFALRVLGVGAWVQIIWFLLEGLRVTINHKPEGFS